MERTVVSQQQYLDAISIIIEESNVKLKELDFDLKAVTTEKGREYQTPNGNSYPSVTTVLSEYNKKAIKIFWSSLH